jgi:hypothetical protein
MQPRPNMTCSPSAVMNHRNTAAGQQLGTRGRREGMEVYDRGFGTSRPLSHTNTPPSRRRGVVCTPSVPPPRGCPHGPTRVHSSQTATEHPGKGGGG